MARGSRYGIRGQLIGPAVMDQLSWIDVAKSNLHIEIGAAAPSVVFDATAAHGSISTLGDLSPLLEAGDLIRVLAGAADLIVSLNGATNTSAAATRATSIFIASGSTLNIIVPPKTEIGLLETDDYNVSTIIGAVARIELIKDD